MQSTAVRLAKLDLRNYYHVGDAKMKRILRIVKLSKKLKYEFSLYRLVKMSRKDLEEKIGALKISQLRRQLRSPA